MMRNTSESTEWSDPRTQSVSRGHTCAHGVTCGIARRRHERSRRARRSAALALRVCVEPARRDRVGAGCTLRAGGALRVGAGRTCGDLAGRDP